MVMRALAGVMVGGGLDSSVSFVVLGRKGATEEG